jgi:hypothetical protein
MNQINEIDQIAETDEILETPGETIRRGNYGQENRLDYRDIHGHGLGAVDIYGLGFDRVTLPNAFFCPR